MEAAADLEDGARVFFWFAAYGRNGLLDQKGLHYCYVDVCNSACRLLVFSLLPLIT